MPISHKNKCIFIHIPKTAGTSIAKNLFATSHVEKTDEEGNPIIINKHATANDIRNIVGENIWNSYFKFTVVRNPWDMMLSSYAWWCQIAIYLEHVRKDAQIVRNMKDFNEFMDSYYGKECISQYQGNMFDWFIDKNGEIIVDYIAKFETLDKDYKEICNRMGIAFSPLSHKKKSQHIHYSNYYNEKTMHIVESRFKKEIEYFGYAFEMIKHPNKINDISKLFLPAYIKYSYRLFISKLKLNYPNLYIVLKNVKKNFNSLNKYLSK